MASWSSRKAELMAKHSAINPVISVEHSDTGSKNLLKPAPMSCAVSAVAMRAMSVFRGQRALDQQFIRFSEPLEQTFLRQNAGGNFSGIAPVISTCSSAAPPLTQTQIDVSESEFARPKCRGTIVGSGVEDW